MVVFGGFIAPPTVYSNKGVGVTQTPG